MNSDTKRIDDEWERRRLYGDAADPREFRLTVDSVSSPGPMVPPHTKPRFRLVTAREKELKAENARLRAVMRHLFDVMRHDVNRLRDMSFHEIDLMLRGRLIEIEDALNGDE